MNKQTILRYLNNELADAEKAAVLDWIESSPENRRYFHTVKNLWTMSNLEKESGFQGDFKDLERRIEKSRPMFPGLRKIAPAASRIAAVLFLPLMLAVTWLAVTRQRPEPLPQSDEPGIVLYTPLCAQAEVTLPDGTKVWLNSGSKLTYPRFFEGENREVQLDGEAYFDVTENKSYPFIVKTPQQVNVIVKGTAFNLRAYSDDNDAEVVLVHGSVDFRQPESGTKVALEPRQLARYARNESAFNVEKNVDISLYTAWKEGILAFENANLEEFSKKIERWYGVTIRIEDPKLLQYTYTGKFKEESIRQVLELMKQTSNLDYRIREKEITLSLKR